QSQNQHLILSPIAATSGPSQQSIAVGAQALLAKAACTGGIPCTRCLNANTLCVYGDRKRDKDKKLAWLMLSRESNSLSRHFNAVTDALHRIKFDINLSSDDMRAAIDDVLQMLTFRASRQSLEAEEEEEEGISDTENLDMIGLTGSLDITYISIDWDDIKATGYIGKSLSVAWAKRAADETLIGCYTRLVLLSYYTEDADVEFFDTSDINLFEWPEQELADTLVELYFTTTYKACLIVDKFNFMRRYNQFDRLLLANFAIEDMIWLGTLNTIFAISAVHTYLTRSRNRDYDWDYLVYITRAKMLCFDTGLFYKDASKILCILSLVVDLIGLGQFVALPYGML
ncbi:hypothetical protein DL98DRAFT_535505, partial [Cadophora sp. DSE1049]